MQHEEGAKRKRTCSTTRLRRVDQIVSATALSARPGLLRTTSSLNVFSKSSQKISSLVVKHLSSALFTDD